MGPMNGAECKRCKEFSKNSGTLRPEGIGFKGYFWYNATMVMKNFGV